MSTLQPNSKSNPSAIIDHDHLLIHVCAWCMPGENIYSVYPHLQSLEYRISHGICPDCLSQVKEQAKAVAPSRSLSFYQAKYGPDFLKKLPMYCTARRGTDFVKLLEVDRTTNRVRVESGAGISWCDYHELDDFVL